MTEKEMVKEAKRDVQSFEHLYDKYFLQIFKYIMLRVNDRDIAEEICSNVFYKAMDKIHLFKWKSIPFSSWLYRIASNEISNYFRKEKKNKKLVDALIVEKDDCHYDDYEEYFDFKFIHQYIKKLPEKDQQVIVLRYFEKLSFESISQIMNKKENYVRVILHRALRKLEKIIPKEVLKDVYRKVS